MNGRWRICVSALVALLALSAGGLGTTTNTGQAQDAGQKTTIRFWTTTEDGYADWVARFEQANPTIDVETEFMGNYDEMAQKVQAGIAGNALPNVAQMGQRHGLPQVIDSGVLVPVTDYLAAADIADVRPGLWSRYEYKGQKWAVPFGASTPGVWYNKTAFAAAGLDPNAPPQATRDQVVEYALKLTKDTNGDGQIDQWGFSTCADVPWYVRPMVMQAGGRLYDEQGNPTINTPQAVEALRFFRDAVHEHKIAALIGHQTAEQDFKSGKVGILFCSTSVRAAFAEEIGTAFEFGVGFLPQREQRAVGLGGNALVVFKGDAAQQQAAATLVQFLTSTDLTAEMGITSGYVAIRESAMPDARIQGLLADDPYAKTIYDHLQYVGDAGINPGDAILWSSLLNAVETVQTDAGADPQAILDGLQEELQTYLANYA